MKILLTLLLLIPSLSLGSEKKARELYVNAKADLIKNGCGFEMLISQFSEIVYDIDNVEFEEIYPLIEVLKKCGNHYKDNTLPVFDKIISDYADTEVAYNLLSGDEYISEALLMGLLTLIEANEAEIEKELKIKEKIKQENLKYQEEKLEKEKIRLEALEKENLKYQNAEPMTNQEITTLVNQIQGCLSIPKSFDIPSEDVTVNIQVNKNRTIKSFKIADENSIFGGESDPKIRVLNEISLRALNHPDCETLNVPPEKYFHWREINFTFNFKSVGMWK